MSDSAEMVDGLRMAHGYPMALPEFEQRLATCARIGHVPVVAHRERRGDVLRLYYACQECGCGLVQDRDGWRVRTDPTSPQTGGPGL